MWTIEPTLGAGPLRFGMTPAQVLTACPMLGPALHADRQFDGSITEHRAIDMPRLTYRAGVLSDIDTDRDTPGVRFHGVDLYVAEPAQVIHLLARHSRGLLLSEGSLLFPEIGINTGGFFLPETGQYKRLNDEEDDFRDVDIFRPGLFDAMLAGARPFAPS